VNRRTFLVAAGATAGLRRSPAAADPVKPVFPGKEWAALPPEKLNLDKAKLDALRDLVGGRGGVVRHGYLAYTWDDATRSRDIASAVKPVISTLLVFAVQEGKLKSVDDPVADFEPRLKELNGGKDAGITWRHLASQTSGYGLSEKPGAAYGYNDFALALYYDVLTQKVFKDDGTKVLDARLAGPLGFQDKFTFDAFTRPERHGRLAVSMRDFARFGLFVLRGGRWHDKQLLKPELLKLTLTSPIPADTPLAAARDADMLPGQRSIGGGKRITPVGPGFYSFNWWLYRTDQLGRRLYAAAPPDTAVAAGHGGKRMLWLLPTQDLVVAWNDSPLDDHDASPADPDTKCNRAAKLIAGAAA
jgi:CubicO group peptidase (beta-lactamase class C family)